MIYCFDWYTNQLCLQLLSTFTQLLLHCSYLIVLCFNLSIKLMSSVCENMTTGSQSQRTKCYANGAAESKRDKLRDVLCVIMTMLLTIALCGKHLVELLLFTGNLVLRIFCLSTIFLSGFFIEFFVSYFACFENAHHILHLLFIFIWRLYFWTVFIFLIDMQFFITVFLKWADKIRPVSYFSHILI